MVFLDDLGRNLKSAREVGMITVRVRETEKALRELASLVGVRLVEGEGAEEVEGGGGEEVEGGGGEEVDGGRRENGRSSPSHIANSEIGSKL